MIGTVEQKNTETDLLSTIQHYSLLPVIQVEKKDQARPLAEALIAGDLPLAEVTFRTEAALDALKIMGQIPEIVLGAGTVLTEEQVAQAADCGAQFIVCPGTNPRVITKGLEKGLTVIPGICSPSDIDLAMSFGLTTLKFFPAEAYGGVKTLKALSAPYKQVKFIPTGGIQVNNLTSYLEVPSVVACGGSWMVSLDLVRNQMWDVITESCLEARSLIHKRNNEE